MDQFGLTLGDRPYVSQYFFQYFFTGIHSGFSFCIADLNCHHGVWHFAMAVIVSMLLAFVGGLLTLQLVDLTITAGVCATNLICDHHDRVGH